MPQRSCGVSFPLSEASIPRSLVQSPMQAASKHFHQRVDCLILYSPLANLEERIGGISLYFLIYMRS